MNEPLDITTLRYLNESAIHEQALKCSKKFRAGLFTRVGQEFIDEVKADAERMIRELRGKFPTFHDPLPESENSGCVTGLLSDKLAREFNNAICRLIQSKVHRHPSVGKTLGRTR